MDPENPSTTCCNGGDEAESTTITVTSSSSAASPWRQRRRSSGRSCVQTTTVRSGSPIEHLPKELEMRRGNGAAAEELSAPTSRLCVPSSLLGVAEPDEPCPNRARG